LTINEVVAVDARLVQSASHPISNEEIKKQREKREDEPYCVAASCHTAEPIERVRGITAKPTVAFCT
jgi:hypothetical protein